MSQYLEDYKGLAAAWDAARPCSQQTTVGWSGMADCRAYLAHLEAGVWPTDVVDKWRAIAGTALHAWWTHLRRQYCHDHHIPAAFDVPVTYGGVKGNLDEVIWPDEDGGRWEVTDYKFPKLSSVRLWEDEAFLAEMMVQPHGYAAGVLADPHGDYANQVLADLDRPRVTWSPYKLEPDACVARLLGMPVNADTTDDWVSAEQPFNRAVPDAALARLAWVRETDLAPNDPMLRDKPAFFCEKWCEFFTACRGGHEPAELEEITDPEIAAAVDAYGLAGELISANKKIQAELRDQLEGARGRTGRYRIWRGKAYPGKLKLDEAAVEQVLGERGIPISEVQSRAPDAHPKLYVKKA